MKRAISILLAVVMLVSLIPAAAAAQFKRSKSWSDDLFTDVEPGIWFYDTVKTAYELDLMNGTGDGKFNPGGEISLAETIAIAARIHAIHTTGKDELEQGAPWYQVYVDYALANGILSAQLSDYTKKANRLEFAHILAKALPAQELPIINTVEDGAIPDLKQDEDVYMLYRAGILTGTDTNGTFRADATITRSEVAAIAARMADPTLRMSVTLTSGSQSGTVVPDYNEPTVNVPTGGDVVADEMNDLTVPYDQAYPDLFASGEVEYSGEQIMIKVASAPTGAQQAALSDAGVTSLEEIMDLGDAKWYKAYVSDDVNTVMDAVRALSFVLVAEYDFAYKTDAVVLDSDVQTNAKASEQWYLGAGDIQKGWGHLKNPHKRPNHDEEHGGTGSTNVSGVVAGEGIVVAVIDTGVDYTHVDLAQNIWHNPGEINNNGIDDDGNGYIDDYYGANVITGEGNAMDDQGHGTHVAGIIAGVNNNEGIVGIAYNATIMPIKAGMASGYFNQSDIAKAILYAYEHGADVINMSFGGSASSIAVQDALASAYTRCVLVAAAGNDGAHNEGLYAKPCYPAAYSYVLGVMSVDENGVESSFTNYDVRAFNSVEYEVYAPGDEMLSTVPNNGYATWSGTSMAAPVVSAMAALLRSEFRDNNTYPTKFIYGQICGTGTQQAVCCAPMLHGLHNLPTIANVYNALTVLPKPDVGMTDYALFDTAGLKGNSKNDGDGVIDAGETVALGFTLRNKWGKSKNTTITVSTNDPYVTFTTPSVNIGEVGTYSTADCGQVIVNNQLVGWENPIYMNVASNCPNDYIVTLNVTVTCKNALDSTDTATYTSADTIDVTVRRGVELPSVISQNMTLTADQLYIIPNAAIIMEGATVTVEAGTQIQFWGDDPEDPYAIPANAYLQVGGKLICKGTPDNPVEMFPSEQMNQFRVEIRVAGNGRVALEYTNVVNPYLQITETCYAKGCHFSQNYRNEWICNRWLYNGVMTTGYSGAYFGPALYEDCAFYLLGAKHYDAFSNGLCDGCLFVDCAMRLDGTYENCVFMGNNNYMGEERDEYSTNGHVSTMNLAMSPLVTGLQSSAVDPETGTIYLLLKRGGSSVNGYTLLTRSDQRFAESLGGSLVCINSQEEKDFIESRFTNYSFGIGLRYDPAEGFVWADGTKMGDFFPVEELLSVSLDWWSRNVAEYEIWGNQDYHNGYMLVEIPGSVVNEITLDRYEVLLDTDTGYQVNATVYPTNMAGAKLIYESEDPTVAAVSASGYVTAKGVGSTVIRVYSPDKYVYNTLNVTVSAPVGLTSIDLGEDFRLNIGESKQLAPVLTPVNTSKQYLVYTSDNENMVTVSTGGIVTAHGVGAAAITVTNPDTGISDAVVVEGIIPATGISTEEPLYATKLTAAETVDVLNVTVTPANATYKNLVWTSSNPEILAVDAQGNLVKKAAGNATLRATVEGTDLYTEVVVCLTDMDTAVTVVQMERLNRNGFEYTMALLSDGSLWCWGNDMKVPQKLTMFDGIHVKQFGVDTHQLVIVDNTGTLNVYGGYYQDSPLEWHPDNYPIYNTPVTNVAKLTSKGGTYYYLKSDGSVWCWGSNSNGQLGIGSTGSESRAVQMSIDVPIVDIVAGSGYVVLLDADGNAYYAGSNYDYSSNTPCFYKDGVVSIRKTGSELVAVEYAASIEFGLGVNLFEKKGQKTYYNSYGGDLFWLGADGKVYSNSGNTHGQAGVGTTGHVNDVPMLKVENAVELFVTDYTVYVQTADGKFYGVGLNNRAQIPNLSAGNQSIPTRIYFGLEAEDASPTLEQNNLQNGVLNQPVLVLDYDQALMAGSEYATIRMTDDSGVSHTAVYNELSDHYYCSTCGVNGFMQGDNNNVADIQWEASCTAAGEMVGIRRTFALDKVELAPMNGFVAGHTYTLTIPASAFTNKFGVATAQLTITFTAGAGAVSSTGGSGGTGSGAASEVIHQTQINPDAPERGVWTDERVMAAWTAFEEAGYNTRFYNNAILNRLTLTQDIEYYWLRVTAWDLSSVGVNEVYASTGLGGNWWGTTNENLINAQILDFNDLPALVDLNEGAYLTTAPSNVWPFAVKAGLIDKTGADVTSVGNETVTFYVEFNRAMDTGIDLDVRFGSTYPYADYIVDGHWVSATRWEGTTTLTTLIEGGYQFWSIDNGKAADAPLELYRDWGRFSFEIDTSEALAMTLQGYATETGIQLTWTQDDFDTLMGYNVYRADQDEDAYYQRLNSSIIPVGTEKFFDSTVEPGKDYYYIFTVVKTDLTESEPSGKVKLQSLDTMLPNIYHTPVYEAYVGNNVVISATVTDNLAVQGATLHYSIGNGAWQRVEMQKLNDKYSALISGNNVTLDGIRYYITATDGVGMTSLGTQTAPYVITVKATPTSLMPGDVNGDGVIGIADALLVLRAKNNKVVLNAEQFDRADWDNDGKLSAAEALAILRYANGEINSLQ